MSAVDSLLSDTADYLQSAIKNNKELSEQLRLLFAANKKPQIVRGLAGVGPGAQCVIVIGDSLVG